MNNVKCRDCVHYDPQSKFTPRGPKDAWYGWCAAKSVYPHKAPDGQVIPDGVQRADAEQPIAKPFIVQGDAVQTGCTNVVKR